MTIKIAQLSDLANLCHFYKAVCDHQQYEEYSPKWHWQDYPSEQGLAAAIREHQVLMNVIDGTIAAAGVLSVGEDPTYRNVPWRHHFTDDEIAVLHLFAVGVQYRGQGVAKQTLQAILDQARANGQKVLHLDIVDPNLPAEKAYLKAGFIFNNSQIINFADLGPTPAKLFEYVL